MAPRNDDIAQAPRLRIRGTNAATIPWQYTSYAAPMRGSMKFGVIGLCLAALVTREAVLTWPGTAVVRILDVGQGSAALIVSKHGRRALVDGGPDHSVLGGLHRGMPFLTRRIDLVVLSHPDSDHLTGLISVLERYDVGMLLLSDVPKSSARYDALLALAIARGIPLAVADPLHDIALDDDVLLDIVWPPPPGFPRPTAANDLSVAVRVVSGSAAVLLPGDLSEKAEALLMRNGQELRSDVLVLGHHGSRTSSSTGFILAVGPSLGIVSAGADNHYGHPSPATLARFAALHIPVRSTLEEGDIVVKMNSH